MARAARHMRRRLRLAVELGVVENMILIGETTDSIHWTASIMELLKLRRCSCEKNSKAAR